jgi:hypothetical protein
MEFTQTQVNSIVAEAQLAARQAAMAALQRYGDRDACGFAWTSIYKVKGNTKLGKMLKAAGVRQTWDKTFQLWNPAGVGVQSMGILEEGARAAAEVFRQYGFEAYAGSRMD